MNTLSIDAVQRARVPQSSADCFEIKVPASIANLGPGFDTLAVAVQLYLRLRVKKLPGCGELHFRFLDHQLHGENCIERAYRSLAGADFDRLPSLSVEVRSEIPMRAGLGSSAAASVAGLRLYEAVAGPVPAATLLNAACALESHPDNAAASLLGGLTISCQLADDIVHATSVAVAGFTGIRCSDARSASDDRRIPGCAAAVRFTCGCGLQPATSRDAAEFLAERRLHAAQACSARPHASTGASAYRAGFDRSAGIATSRSTWRLPQRLRPIDRRHRRTQSSRDREPAGIGV